MNLKELVKILEENKGAELHIILPNGEIVPNHFHITEVGKVHKTFIDCGGTLRESTVCLLQVWTANDFEHRLVASKLSNILKLGEKVLGEDDYPVEIEYGVDAVSHYKLAQVEVTPKGLLFILFITPTIVTPMTKTKVQYTLSWFAAEGDELVGEEPVAELTGEQVAEWFHLPEGDSLMDSYIVRASQRRYLSRMVKHKIDLNAFDYFLECYQAEG